MQTFKLIGPDAVDVPALALADVEPGATVEVEDPDIAEGMHGSPIWKHIPEQRSQTTKKAASVRTDNEGEES